MFRHLATAGVLLLILSGCAEPPPLADTVVRAGSAAELQAFRQELGTRFAAGELAAFDTALQEIRLEALNRDISPAAAREEYLCRAVANQTVAAVRHRGWEARRGRLTAEKAYLTGLLEQDLTRQKATPTDNIAARIASAREVMARIDRDLAATEEQLAAWR